MSTELSSEEIEAIRQRILERLAGALPLEEETVITCDGCYQRKPLSQFLLYDYWHLCTACAMDYESALASGEVANVNAYIGTCILPEEWIEDTFLS